MALAGEGVQAACLFPAALDGAALDGRTILLHAEQGLGDTLQFARYAALVKARGATVILSCPKKLLAVLQTCPGIDQLIPMGAEPPPFDVYAPLLSLPRLFGTTVATIPASMPYLAAQPELVDRWRDRLAAAPGFRVGLVWQGSATYKKDHQRSAALGWFAPLARVPGVRLFSLQVGPGSEQLGSLGDRFPVIDLGGSFDPASFSDAAAVLKNLDLLVTVDTALAHLGGALGSSVWLALPHAADWRWLHEREDSPWYPTVRLFRQSHPGDWDGVFERIARELGHRAERSLNHPRPERT